MLIFLFEISPKEKRENIVVALNMDGLAPANTVKQIKNNTDRTIDRFLSILKILKIIFNAKYIIPTCNPLIARTCSVPVLANRSLRPGGIFCLLPNKTVISIDLYGGSRYLSIWDSILARME